jgi:hypothetical protein
MLYTIACTWLLVLGLGIANAVGIFNLFGEKHLLVFWICSKAMLGATLL